jgi:glycerol kinase
MAWMLRSDAAVAAAGAAGNLRLGTVDSWLTWNLSGGAVHVTDPSNAGATGLYDPRTGDWSAAALDFFGIPREALATVVASDALVGETAGNDSAIPLSARLGDQMAAAAAHGLVEGMAKLTLGTSAMLDVGVGTTPIAAPAGCYTLPLWRRTVNGSEVEEYMIEGSVNTAGSVVEWLVRVGLLASVDQLDAVAAQGRPGIGFVPALAGLGSPHQDPGARGVVSGIGLDTTPADLVRGALAGIADRITELAAHMGVGGEHRVLQVDGGLSRSRVLLEMIGAKTGVSVVARDPEATLAGAAALAAVSV